MTLDFSNPRIALRDHPRSKSGSSRIGGFFDAVGTDLRFSQRIAEGECSFTAPADSVAGGLGVPGMSLEIVTGDGSSSWDCFEYRVARVSREVSRERGALVLVEGVIPPLWDLEKAGHVRSTTYTQKTAFTITDTPANILTNYVLPYLVQEGYGYYAVGTMDFTSTITVTIPQSGATPRGWINAILEQLTAAELAFDRNAFSSWRIHLVSAFNATAQSPRLLHGLNVNSCRLRQHDDGWANIIRPVSTLSETTAGESLAYTSWKVSGTSGSKITLQSPDGDTTLKAIAKDDQWNGYYLWDRTKGRKYQVVDTLYATQELDVGALLDLATGSIVEFYEDWPSPMKAYGNWDTTSATARIAKYNGNPVGTDAAVVDIISNGDLVADAINNETAHVIGADIRESTFVNTYTTTARDNGTTKKLTLTSVAGLSIGMWGFIRVNAAEPWGMNFFTFTITNISGNDIWLGLRYGWQTYDLGATGAYAQSVRIYQETSNILRITAIDAVNNRVTCSSAPTIFTVGSALEVYREVADAKPVVALRSDASIATNRVRVNKRADLPLSGEHQLLSGANPDMSTWTTTPGAPNGWRVGANLTRQTNPYHGFSFGTYACALVSGAYAFGPRIYPLLGPNSGKLVLWARIKTPISGSWVSGVHSATFYIYPEGPITYATFGPVGSGLSELQPDTLYTLVIALNNLTAAQRAHVQACGLRWGFNNGAIVDLDGLGAYYSEDYDTRFATLIAADKANVAWSKGNSLLLLKENPAKEFDLDILDLYALNPARFANQQFTVGAYARLDVAPIGVSATVRVLEYEYRVDRQVVRAGAIANDLTRRLVGGVSLG